MGIKRSSGAARDLNRETQQLWERKAEFWDQRMAEGNSFQRVLTVQPGEVVLDIACGNRVMSRRLAQLGVIVVATDFSPTFLERARARTTEHADHIEYLLADATNEMQMLALGEGRFDAAICNMALHAMADVRPLFRVLPRLLKPTGRFVFSIPHPAFNFPLGSKLALEEEDHGGELVEVYYVKVCNYLHIPPTKSTGMPGEPAPTYFFHRPLHTLLGVCFDSGFVLDGLEEPSFGRDQEAGRPLGWANFKNIPPILLVRMRPIAGGHQREDEH